MLSERIYKVISNVLNVPLGSIDENTSPETVSTWDSLKHMNLILALEDEFHVQFSDEQIVNMLSARQITQALAVMTADRTAKIDKQ